MEVHMISGLKLLKGLDSFLTLTIERFSTGACGLIWRTRWERPGLRAILGSQARFAYQNGPVRGAPGSAAFFKRF
jgi:hypothetical protein